MWKLKYCLFILVIMTCCSLESNNIFSPTFSHGEIGFAWQNSSWHHRLDFQVDSGNYTRINYPISFTVNFSEYVNENVSGDSFRIYNSTGFEFPFDQECKGWNIYDILFEIPGKIEKSTLMNFSLYFDVASNGMKPVPYYERDYLLLKNYYNRFAWNPLGTGIQMSDNYTFNLVSQYMNNVHGEWHKFDGWVFGNVEATFHDEKDIWNGTMWLRHYIDNRIFKSSPFIYICLKNNGSDARNTYVHALANYSCGNDGLDDGLRILTDDLNLSNFSSLNWSGSRVMANETLQIYNKDKNYASGEELRVIPFVSRSRYVIMWDGDFANGTVREDYNAICFRTYKTGLNESSFDGMVFEIWRNKTGGGLVENFFVNVTINANYWWADEYFNIENHNGETLHNYQEKGEYRLGLSYLHKKDENNFRSIIEDLLDSDENPANVTINSHSLSSPMKIEINEPLNGTYVNKSFFLNVSFTGDTLNKKYYALDSKRKIEFNGIVMVNASEIYDEKDSFILRVLADDTNGTILESSIILYFDKRVEIYSFAGFTCIASVSVSIIAIVILYKTNKMWKKWKQKTKSSSKRLD